MRLAALTVQPGWPLPALIAWSVAWVVFASMRAIGAPQLLSVCAATLVGVVAMAFGSTPWRRVFLVMGFPLSLAASGAAAAMPAWAWLCPLALLALVYPLGLWGDAPMFPTPRHALEGIAHLAPLRDHASVLDAGCGVGDGLQELRREYPLAVLRGLEWSWPLRLVCALRCRYAEVRRGDIWKADWSVHDMVYVFQRPETMRRAFDKAMREMRPGAWLVSLEFQVPGEAGASLSIAGDRGVWLYRVPPPA